MKRPDWYPDELAYAGGEHLDPGYVATYDRKADNDHAEDVAILQAQGLDGTSVVVDLGGGTGTFAEAVAPHCGWVVVVDVSSAMLAALQERVRQLGLANVEVVQAGFLSYEHQGEPADFIYSRNALHHLPDFWKAVALKRAASILKPGGVLRLHDLVYAFDPGDEEAVFEAWFASARQRPEDGWTRPELEEHVRQEYSTFSWLLEPILERAGFDILEAGSRQAKTYGAYLCRKRA
jgi:ubiquinone/menaquinone biosynthesis C-methylase UbiE